MARTVRIHVCTERRPEENETFFKNIVDEIPRPNTKPAPHSGGRFQPALVSETAKQKKLQIAVDANKSAASLTLPLKTAARLKARLFRSKKQLGKGAKAPVPNCSSGEVGSLIVWFRVARRRITRWRTQTQNGPYSKN